ncbi:hypothetical protein JOQ06_023793 [Pogonophryne albipinna]|uniref:HAT C-terminal dimerisation domain-containing protein n=1 Tax=Pogonophryne albipinna TaxID=1090488 RepID=A0AAD6BL04_9TELE|nr:hypothetical protein JOQ06_023793 [Pogonophryne albipinna]
MQLSATRWASQVRSVKAVVNNLPAILACLGTMKTAQGILSNLCKPKTIYMLVMFAKLLGITEGLHRYLQGERLDLGGAAQYKTAILETLTDLRTEPGAEDVFKSTMTICEEHHIQAEQKRLDGFVVESACGATSNPTTPGDFRGQLYYPCLDRMIQELTHRFSDVGEELMSGIRACNPTTATFLSEDALKSLASHYKIQLKSEELLVAKHFSKRRLEKEKVPDIATVFQMLDSDMFPTLKAVLQLALTIPCAASFAWLGKEHSRLLTLHGAKTQQHDANAGQRNPMDNLDTLNF